MSLIVKILILFRGLTASPEESIDLAVQFEQAPAEYKEELLFIAKRESGLQSVKIHKIDSWASRRAWKRAMKKGWLSPRCPFHKQTSGWATRGNFGLFAAYNLRYLGLSCAPAHLLDNPFLSAVASIRKMHHVCQKYGACSADDRRLIWAGLQVYLAYKNRIRGVDENHNRG